MAEKVKIGFRQASNIIIDELERLAGLETELTKKVFELDKLDKNLTDKVEVKSKRIQTLQGNIIKLENKEKESQRLWDDRIKKNEQVAEAAFSELLKKEESIKIQQETIDKQVIELSKQEDRLNNKEIDLKQQDQEMENVLNRFDDQKIGLINDREALEKDKQTIESDKILLKTDQDKLKAHIESLGVKVKEINSQKAKVDEMMMDLRVKIEKVDQIGKIQKAKALAIDSKNVALTKKENDLRLKEIKLEDRESTLKTNLNL